MLSNQTQTTDQPKKPAWGSLFELSVQIRFADRKQAEKSDVVKEQTS